MNKFGPITFEQGSVVKQNIHIDSINIDLPVSSVVTSQEKPCLFQLVYIVVNTWV